MSKSKDNLYIHLENTLRSAPHSLRFDELAVVLPAHIQPASLRQLAQQLQNELIGNIDDVSIKSDTAQNHDIQTASRILSALKNTPIADASVLVAITHESKPKLLLTRRAGHLKSHAGQVSFAGGKYEPSDGNNIVTALREACEETALPPSQVQIVGQLPIQTSKAGLSVRPIVALVSPNVTYVPELGEIERIFWADFETLMTQPTVDYVFTYKQNEQSSMVATPSWIIDNETVWGLTGKIIASLLKIGFDRQVEWYYRMADE
ncbi:NUDIX hydrolase [Psychrobacter sp. I-STPA10]|uniref:NUDIX hydrolase n=1 Tax=Psychrobacter sp. I-STPA10 TaxID=2585769 RepID=UPI001E32CAC0|nr:CoA pyrophosphatase [Psychrobacter sp. I-STPA10]